MDSNCTRRHRVALASGEAADHGHHVRHGWVSQKHRGAHAETSQDNDSIGNVATGNPDLENIGTNARDLKATPVLLLTLTLCLIAS